VPTPKAPGPYDIIVKVAVASLCHTDGMVSAGAFSTKLPCTASHEGAGTVVSTGSSVTKFKHGDRVMCGLPAHRCDHCPDCLGPENYTQYCKNIEGHIGVTLDGAFAEYVLVDSRSSAKLPDSVSFETAAPLACAGCTVWRGVLQTELKSGEWIAFVGSGGGLGHLGIQFAKALGLNVIGIDARDEGLELSREAGAHVVIDARKGDKFVVEEVGKVTNEMGADATVNVSDAKVAAATACAVTKMHGLMIQIAQVNMLCFPIGKQMTYRFNSQSKFPSRFTSSSSETSESVVP
jgi:propanol-preferring alcohol dehydrogenase